MNVQYIRHVQRQNNHEHHSVGCVRVSSINVPLVLTWSGDKSGRADREVTRSYDRSTTPLITSQEQYTSVPARPQSIKSLAVIRW